MGTHVNLLSRIGAMPNTHNLQIFMDYKNQQNTVFKSRTTGLETHFKVQTKTAAALTAADMAPVYVLLTFIITNNRHIVS